MDEQLPRGTETILLVDDDAEIRRSTTGLLEKLGYKVIQAADADQAVRLVTISNVHLVIMDVVLPGMSGLTAAGKLAQIRPGIRTLYVSGYTSEEVLEDQEEERPGVAFLEKPYTAETLATSVRELLDLEIRPDSIRDEMPRGNESVLVVEDDHATRKAMVKTLDKLGYHVLEAHYPDRALAIAVNSRIDLVVMDVFLPGMSGLSLARTIHGAKPWIRYLFVSGKAPEELVFEGSPVEEKTCFLAKPFGPEELARAVREALDEPGESPDEA